MMYVRKMMLMVASFSMGCDGGEAEGFTWPVSTGLAVSNYAVIVEATYADSVTEAAALQSSIDALVATPSETTLGAARQAWLDSREPYLQSEVFRFYDGPIDDPADGPEGLINAWPLDENYIDYVVGDETAGIINELTQAIDAESLASLNEQGGEANIATGYHAIEFLLWGQDLSDTGPGERPFTDYVTDESGTAANQDRRGQYLSVTSEMLVADLTEVADQWAPSAGYRNSFEGDPEGSFKAILTGMTVLSGFETGGERLQASLDSGDREDEHSCFSDNTHRDMIQDIQGIKNVWTGTYTRLDGTKISDTSVKEIVEAVDAELAARLDDQINTSLELANALQTPYELEIAPSNPEGRARVQALVQSLQDQEGMLSEVFQAFELTVSIPE